jgi:sterol carrier protein 2
LYSARQAVRWGQYDCVLALGFEKMQRGALSLRDDGSPSPMELHWKSMFSTRTPEDSPFAPQMFGNAGREHIERYGSTAEHFAWIGYKNHKHSVNNPYAQFQKEFTLDEIKSAPVVHQPLTRLQCSPTSDGAAAAVVASEWFVDKHDLWSTAVEIAGQALATDDASSFADGSSIRVCGFGMTVRAADQALREAGAEIDEVDVIELHDCFSANELITYEALGLCAVGEGHKLVEAEATTYGGDGPVVNPSGGLISKGHPLGATGLAQCAELTWQMRGTAEARQVADASIALQHNLGLGGACVVSVYRAPKA